MTIQVAPCEADRDDVAVAARGEVTEGAATGRERLAVTRWVLTVLAWLIILASLLLLAVTVIVPRIAGATPYTVLTGSMRPTMPPGTLVVDKQADPDTVGVGTVVTYQLVSGDPTVVTHRVVAIRTNLDGSLEFQTQGDANPVPDSKWVKPEQIRGVRWYSVPILGRLNLLITGHQRQVAVYGAAVGLVLYSGLMFAGALRDRKRARSTPRFGRHAA